jgi:hypothetical protein
MLNNICYLDIEQCGYIEEEKPNTPKKANTGSAKLSLPIAIQLYYKTQVKTTTESQS